MDEYSIALKKELVEQFKGKANIEALVEVLGSELQEIADFYEQLRTERDLYRAVGKQLDGVGDIAVLTRQEAGKLAAYAGRGHGTDDETYRKYLIYKILKNTCDCTYPEIIKAFRMFWDKPLYYSENPEYPAVMVLETGTLAPEDHAENLLAAPIIKAAGVGIHITATTEAPVIESEVNITPFLGRGTAITKLPELEPEMPVVGLYVAPVIGRGMSITKLPSIEPDLGVAAMMGHATAAMVGTITETRLPELEDFNTEIHTAAVGRFFTAPHGTVMETKLPELKEKTV